MNPYYEARCPKGHEWLQKSGTPFVCPKCKHKMQPGRVGPLTSRQCEVVALIGEGFTNSQIADELVIRECTVENHTHAIFRNLRLKTRTQVARYAWEHGITRQEPPQ